MAEALTTEPTGGALTGVRLQQAAGEVGLRRIGDQANRFRSALDLQRQQLSEFRGAMRRRQRGEALTDILTIAGLATGGILGAGTAIGAAGGASLGSRAGQILGAGIGGEGASPELQVAGDLALNLRDQQRLGDIEAAAGTRLGDDPPVPAVPETPDLPPLPEMTLPDELRPVSPMRSWLPKRRRQSGGR